MFKPHKYSQIAHITRSCSQAAWDYRPPRHYRRRSQAHKERWQNARQPRVTKIFLGVYGPNSSLRAGAVYKLEIAPQLEVKESSAAEPKIIPLGNQSKLKFKALITRAVLANETEGVHLYCAQVVQIRHSNTLDLVAPKGYSLPEEDAAHLHFPATRTQFLMIYQPGQRGNDCQGVIMSYFDPKEPTVEYLPEKFDFQLDKAALKKLTNNHMDL